MSGLSINSVRGSKYNCVCNATTHKVSGLICGVLPFNTLVIVWNDADTYNCDAGYFWYISSYV